MLNLLKELCALPGVSGREDKVREYIIAKTRPYADEIRCDAIGNVLVFKKGRVRPKQSVMLAAHMDEVGVIITEITEEGYLKFDFVGGIDRRVVIGKKVFVGEEGVPGVMGIKSFHLVEREESERIPRLKEMYIDIGADNREEAEKKVSPGDVGCFDPGVVEFGEGRLKAKALDDRIGCAVMLKLIEAELPVDTWFAFTVQEEVGCRGAFGAAFALKPEIALIIEGTTAADLPSQEGGAKVCIPGNGPVVPFMDGGTVYDRALYTHLRALAADNGIPSQTKTYISGGTDAQAIQRSRAGVRVAAISAALRNIHSPSSVGVINDFENMLKLAQLFLEDLKE